MEEKAWEQDKPKDDGIDRGEIRTVFSTSTATIKASGTTMCREHRWRKLSDTEIGCTVCPTALIVNHEVLDSMLAK